MRNLFRQFYSSWRYRTNHFPHLTDFLENNPLFRKNVIKFHNKKKGFWGRLDEWLENELIHGKNKKKKEKAKQIEE